MVGGGSGARIGIGDDAAVTINRLLLSILALAGAELVGHVYGHAELTTVTRALAAMFLLNGAATQYRASLSRALRFKAVATSDTVSVIIGLLVAVGLAFAGAGFWALVAQQLVQSAATLALLLCFGRWLPGRPTGRRRCAS